MSRAITGPAAQNAVGKPRLDGDDGRASREESADRRLGGETESIHAVLGSNL